MLLEVNDLKTYYYTLGGLVKAVDHISLVLSERETLGIVGESGCGKSTTALSIMRLLPTYTITAGDVLLDGQNILNKSDEDFRKIRWKRISMVFQSAMNSLNPMFRIRDQITEAILVHEEISKKEALTRARDLMEMVRIDEARLNDYPHELSGGMKQRVVIAMALANYPSLVIADEPTTALDVVVQAQILQLIEDLQEKMGISLILITHDLAVVAGICEKVAVMYAGKIVEYGDVHTLFTKPKHPYTERMLNSFPSLSRSRHERVTSIPGDPPSLINPPSGCRFHPRCTHAQEVCKKEEPRMAEFGKGCTVLCHLYTRARY